MELLRKKLAAAIAGCAGLVVIGLIAAVPCSAATIPAWLDEGITQWNKANPASRLQFVNIKDSYAWYTMPATPELESKDIRGKVYGIAYKNGYANTQDEEIVTTARPPAPSGASKDKKCWSRSFSRDIQKGSPTTVERMLTTLVCEDGPNWSVGFRTLQ
jgi:hypothetical protein